MSKIKVREGSVWVERNLRVKIHDAFITGGSNEIGVSKLGSGIPEKPLKIYLSGTWQVV